jgi:hypothetical protein
LGLNFWGHFFPQRSCHTAKKTKQNNWIFQGDFTVFLAKEFNRKAQHHVFF